MNVAPARVDRLLRAAIAARRLVSFTLNGHPRIGEPHDYGIINGAAKLFFYQCGGTSESGSPLGWRWAELPKIIGLTVLEERFRGSRPTPSGRHVRWPVLIATVSPRPMADAAPPRAAVKGSWRQG